MAALRCPVRQIGFECGVGDVIGSRGAWAHLDVINQTFTHIQQPNLHVDDPRLVIGAVVQCGPDRLDICPDRLACLIAVGPVVSQAMIAARVNQLQAAASAAGPLAPAAPGAIGYFVLDDVNRICRQRAMTVRFDQGIAHGQRQPFAIV